MQRLVMLSTTAERAIAAYGGQARWKEASAVEATVSTGGLDLNGGDLH